MNERNLIQETVAAINKNYTDSTLFIYDCCNAMPSRDVIIDTIRNLRRVMFPGYFGDESTSESALEYFVGDMLTRICCDLTTQLETALIYNGNATREEAPAQAETICSAFIARLPHIQNMLLKDVQAGFDGDPAAKSPSEVIFSYPGLFAIFVYRIAHELYLMDVPFIPRIMTEYAHSRTGIDINSGAEIGEYFFIDHGTGVVIGETTKIGNNVKLYQGVTLGALSTRYGQQLSGKKRHPTIEDNVTIYSNASILGGDTVIGEDSVIGGNCFIIKSVPAGSRVSGNSQG